MMETTNDQPQLVNEDSLVLSAANDPEAFSRLYDLYFPRLYKYILFRVYDGQTADDLVSEVFERIVKHLSRYIPGKAPFGAWVFSIARHVVNDHLRRQSRNRWLSLDILSRHAETEKSLESDLMDRDQTERLRRALKTLSTRENDLVSLKFSSGLTNRQIAALAGLKENNVGIILFRVMRKLHVEMKKQEETDE